MFKKPQSFWLNSHYRATIKSMLWVIRATRKPMKWYLEQQQKLMLWYLEEEVNSG